MPAPVKAPYDKDEILRRLQKYGAVSWGGTVYTDEDALETALEGSDPALFEPAPTATSGLENSLAPFLAQSAQTADQVATLHSQIADTKSAHIETQSAHITDLQNQVVAITAERDALKAQVAELSKPKAETKPAAAPKTADAPAVVPDLSTGTAK